MGSTTVTALIQTLCTIDNWWNASNPKIDGHGRDFCCGDPFWHQTIHQYRSAGSCSLRRCTMGWHEGLRQVRILVLLREPKAKFVSGLYYFARRENRRYLYSTHPANISLSEFDALAHASLEVDDIRQEGKCCPCPCSICGFDPTGTCKRNSPLSEIRLRIFTGSNESTSARICRHSCPARERFQMGAVGRPTKCYHREGKPGDGFCGKPGDALEPL